MRRAAEVIKAFLQRLSFRTGVIVLAMCVPFYTVSFAQMALPISASTKGVLFFYGAFWILYYCPNLSIFALNQLLSNG